MRIMVIGSRFLYSVMGKLIPVHAYLGENSPAAAVYGHLRDSLRSDTAEAHSVSDILSAIAAVGAENSLCAAEIVLVAVGKSLLG